jgi:hypothetical protein
MPISGSGMVFQTWLKIDPYKHLRLSDLFVESAVQAKRKIPNWTTKRTGLV